jgi:uncharacterized protein YnzC (UPF0291/DUF896 family)
MIWKDDSKMEQKRIDRINELARKAKTTEGLTPEELEERAILRREYVDAFKASLQIHLESIVVVDEQGNRSKLKKKK